MSKKIFIFPLISAVLIGCASTGGRERGEDLRYSAAGSIKFAYHLPPGTATDAAGAFMIEQKADKTVADLWALVKYRHFISADRDHLKKALIQYRELAERDREHGVNALNGASCVLGEMERYAESEKSFLDQIAGGRTDELTYYNLYILYRAFSRQDDYIRVLSLMREKFKKSSFASIELGNLLMDGGKNDMAVNYYREAMSIDRQNPEPVHRIAKIRETERKYDEAGDLYMKCMKISPEYCDAYIDYSRMLLSLNKTDEARNVINKGLKYCGSRGLKGL
jgi:tetratricopeptide (TPR) repeat protein